MTEKEAIFVLHKLKPTIPRADGKSTTHILETTALDMAIIALERQNKDYISRESVLDKIRAEVKSLSPEPTAYDVVDGNRIRDAVWETLVDVLQIIDKYKAESDVEKNE